MYSIEGIAKVWRFMLSLWRAQHLVCVEGYVAQALEKILDA